MGWNGKKFINNLGKLCTIKSIQENVAIFEDGTKTQTILLSDPAYFKEINENMNETYIDPNAIDPNQFFKSNSWFDTLSGAANRLNSDDLSKMRDDKPSAPTSTRVVESVIENNRNTDTTPTQAFNEDAAAALREKYRNIDQVKKNAPANAFSNNQKLTKMLEEEGMPAQNQQPNFEQARQKFIPQPPLDDNSNNYQTQPVYNTQQSQYQQNQNIEDPRFLMFKNQKKNTPFKISIDIDKMIPRLDYIEIMEDSYEDISIVEYLADEFTNELLQNPEIIKDIIVTELRKKLENIQTKEGKKEKEDIKKLDFKNSKMLPKIKEEIIKNDPISQIVFDENFENEFNPDDVQVEVKFIDG